MTEQYSVTAEELESFLQRIESQTARIKDETESRKDIYAEAKSRGYDTKILRKLVTLRARRPDDVAEEDAVLDAYKSALGMA